MELVLDKTVLDNEVRLELQKIITDAVNKATKSARKEKPFLSRKGIAEYFGVSPDTISKWAGYGMPVAILDDGRKLYSKKGITQWLEAHERSENKKPPTA